jgi:hypothetical protein
MSRDQIRHELGLTFQPSAYASAKVLVEMVENVPEGTTIQDKEAAAAELRAAVLRATKAAASEALAAHRDVMKAFLGSN